jgi:hypothetical protein
MDSLASAFRDVEPALVLIAPVWIAGSGKR